MAYHADFLSLSYVLGGILDQGRDVFTSGIISEDDYHSLWDALIRRPLAYLSQSTRRLSLDFARNSTDMFQSGTLVKLARPDFLCYMQKTLILRGEEKRSAGDLEVASRELVNKLDEWNAMFYGKLPFVFAYATGGMKIQYVLSFPFLLSLNLGPDTCGYTT
jgi:hypothetical protein